MSCVSETADREQLAQLQILNKAQQRQIEDVERKLEDSRRNMRYVEHQLAIAKGMCQTVCIQMRGGKCCLFQFKAYDKKLDYTEFVILCNC